MATVDTDTVQVICHIWHLVNFVRLVKRLYHELLHVERERVLHFAADLPSENIESLHGYY